MVVKSPYPAGPPPACGQRARRRSRNFDLILFLAMFPAALLGGYLGPQIARRVSPLFVKRVACVGLLLLAVKLLGLF